MHYWSGFILDCAAFLGSEESAEDECGLVQVFGGNDGEYGFFGAGGCDGGFLVLEREDVGEEGGGKEVNVS